MHGLWIACANTVLHICGVIIMARMVMGLTGLVLLFFMKFSKDVANAVLLYRIHGPKP